MMNFMVKSAGVLLCAIFLFSAFVPTTFAARNTTLKGLNTVQDVSSAADAALESSVSFDKFKTNASQNRDFSVSHDEILFEQAIDARRATERNPVMEETGDPYSVNDSWVIDNIISRGGNTIHNSLCRVTLALSSRSGRCIFVSATAMSTGRLDKMGIVSLKLQRRYKDKWMTVHTVSNRYVYNSSRFLFSTTKYNLASGNYYRVISTFYGGTGYSTNTVTRTSGSIRCR
ncbi:MAG: hypothetical protein IJO93_05510 [Clostridia bacterium]|nr:hypothetical protein [Clostridia bacterium]